MKPKFDIVPRRKDEAVTGFPYKELVGALIYVSTCTRPDISFAVGKLSQVYSEPTDEHYSAALMVLSYLGGSADAEIRLGGRGKGLGSEILSFIDSDFAEDVTSRKSVSGIV